MVGTLVWSIVWRQDLVIGTEDSGFKIQERGQDQDYDQWLKQGYWTQDQKQGQDTIRFQNPNNFRNWDRDSRFMIWYSG